LGIFYNYKNGRIHYSDQGEGEVLVLLHGYLETSEIWSNFARGLSAKFRIISIDLPGHGKSSMYGDVHTMEFMAIIIAELIKNLRISKVIIAGHSLGGYIALAFAELFPEMLSGYCLFHSHPFSDSPEAIEKREREIVLIKAGKKDMMYSDNVSRMFATSNLQKFPEALERSKQIASSISGEGIISVLKGMMERSSRLSIMEDGRVPCLWILGALDNYINCEQIQQKVKLPENANVIVLRNSGHMGFIEEEANALEILTGFVEGLKCC
jgi:pimeloyl-ACP methyl ester carboxylesterase